LADLTSSYTDLRKVVFNLDAGTVSDHLIVIPNNELLPGQAVTEAKLNDGDNVMLFPVNTKG
jgi:hypothetical protein